MNEDVPILISLKKLLEYKLACEDYIFLYLLYIGERWKLSKYLTEVKNINAQKYLKLIESGMVEKINPHISTISLNNLNTTQKFKDIIEGINNEQKIENWIEKWYALWPPGIKTGGYYLKTDKTGSLRKMKRFVVKYPEYTQEDIMQATENYLREQSIKGYSFTKLAPYFIEKDGLSVLAGECEAVKEKATQVIMKGDMYGNEEL
jgi:hypothetical protein